MAEKTEYSFSEWASFPLERQVVIARVVNADHVSASPG